MSSAAAARVDAPDDARWITLAAEALELVGLDGARVVGHLERRDGTTFARTRDGTVLGWADVSGTYDATGRRLRFEPDAERLLDRGLRTLHPR